MPVLVLHDPQITFRSLMVWNLPIPLLSQPSFFTSCPENAMFIDGGQSTVRARSMSHY